MKIHYKTYRTLLAVALLAIYVISPFRLYIPYLNYKINYKYISTVLCENKEKPKMACNGKCHLKKELKKTAEEEKNSNKQVRQSLQEEMISQLVFIITPNVIVSTGEGFIFYSDKQLYAAYDYLAPPPQC